MERSSIGVDVPVGLPPRSKRVVDGCIIRLIDIVGSLFGLGLLAPVLPLIAFFIRLDSRGSPLFRQKRAGENGVVFMMYKFRTMCDGADKLPHQFRKENEPVVKVANDSRVTRLGSVLRRYSIDELPQLINVLKGDMSLVGARPPVLKEFDAYDEYHKARLAGKPGLTGLAQINGRSDLDFESIVQFDIHYNRSRSASLYFKILLQTVLYCLSAKSSY